MAPTAHFSVTGRKPGDRKHVITARHPETEVLAPTVRKPEIEVLTLTVPDVCRITGLGATTVWQLVRDRKLEAIRPSGLRRRLVTFRSVLALLGLTEPPATATEPPPRRRGRPPRSASTSPAA
jgi:excisionase family DNA binding protein